MKKAFAWLDFGCILSEDFCPAEGRMEVPSQCADPPPPPPPGGRGAWKVLSSVCEPGKVRVDDVSEVGREGGRDGQME